MIDLDSFSNEYFQLVHLTEDISLSDFKVNPDGYGLEVYLKEYALLDEKSGMARTYLIVTPRTRVIAGYFTLRTGLITVSRGLFKGFDTYTGIELANFAVNENYKKMEIYDNIPQLGLYIFSNFIFPLVVNISSYVGAGYLYIFSLPKNKLMAHYQKMGFMCTSEKASQFVYSHVKPVYDKGCKFMFQKIQ